MFVKSLFKDTVFHQENSKNYLQKKKITIHTVSYEANRQQFMFVKFLVGDVLLDLFFFKEQSEQEDPLFIWALLMKEPCQSRAFCMRLICVSAGRGDRKRNPLCIDGRLCVLVLVT